VSPSSGWKPLERAKRLRQAGKFVALDMGCVLPGSRSIRTLPFLSAIITMA
jgi:hypothetical protein